MEHQAIWKVREVIRPSCIMKSCMQREMVLHLTNLVLREFNHVKIPSDYPSVNLQEGISELSPKEPKMAMNSGSVYVENAHSSILNLYNDIDCVARH